MGNRRRGARWWGALLAATIGLGLVPGAAGAAKAPPDPILLVHGWRGDPSTWQWTIDQFAQPDIDRSAFAIDLATEDNVKNAAQIRDYISVLLAENPQWTKVDIVAQSMGGLSARQYIKFLKPGVVDTYVSLGTPQYGIYAACLLPQGSGGQMCPASRFLRDLNTGDDTPGSVAWTTIFSTTDGIVPTSSSRLDGGACHIKVPGPDHNNMDNDPTIFGYVLAAIDRAPCPAT